MNKKNYEFEKMNVKTLRLKDSVSATIYEIAKEENMTESEFLRLLIEKGLKEYKLNLAIDAYKKKDVNISGGANLAEITYREFLEVLKEKEIPIMEISPESVKYGLESAEKSLNIKLNVKDYDKLYEKIFTKKRYKK
jgi:predicted HTH domain antitoxin